MTERRETGRPSRKPSGARKPAPQNKTPMAPKTDAEWSEGGERIAKYLARAGIASRREVERLIEAGDVSVNGKVLMSAAFKVTGRETIKVGRKTVQAPDGTRLWRYHKPSGLVTTNKDPQGRATVFEKMPPELPRVMSVGRLDLTSEGLLLLTNDGGLARELELPSRGWIRKYRVRVHGRIDIAKLEALSKGPTVEGVKYGPILATLDEQMDSNAWLTVSIREGKNREVRRVLQ